MAYCLNWRTNQGMTDIPNDPKMKGMTTTDKVKSSETEKPVERAKCSVVGDETNEQQPHYILALGAKTPIGLAYRYGGVRRNLRSLFHSGVSLLARNVKIS